MTHGRGQAARRRSSGGPGFTLIEMLVVISILVLLAGLTLTITTAAIRSSEVRQTESILRVLDQAMQEWELLADRQLTWGVDGVPPGMTYDVHPHYAGADPHTPFNLVLSEMLVTVARPEPIRQMLLSGLPAEALYTFKPGVYPPWMVREEDRMAKDERFDGCLAILDAWGMPIYGLHPGGPPGPNALVIDPDGTEQTINEMYFGVARNRRVCFISAGLDRSFGDLSLPPGTPRFEATRDNLFSYEVGTPAP